MRLELYRRPGTAWKEGQRTVIRNHEIVAFLAGAVIRRLAIRGAPSVVRKEGVRTGKERDREEKERRRLTSGAIVAAGWKRKTRAAAVARDLQGSEGKG